MVDQNAWFIHKIDELVLASLCLRLQKQFKKKVSLFISGHHLKEFRISNAKGCTIVSCA